MLEQIIGDRQIGDLVKMCNQAMMLNKPNLQIILCAIDSLVYVS